ncbi:hypothetical protein DL764_005784 [Monosporascus ibericus]|uniref:C2H2-type domain-containing protein n=1 Tax=Monosporascus ibericus TaxID=155417 RepID=A0A4Q4TAX2_9PEZI|nr:hypothetical protein DL764_005784 [Monosporascus ibericus]
MDGYDQLPHFDFSNVPLINNLGDLPPIDWTPVGQHDLMHGLLPATEPPLAQSAAASGQLVGLEERNAPQYPCGYCYRHQGTNGFRRYDHLVQHLKVYHKIETVDGLSRKAVSSSPAVATAPAVPIPGTFPVAIGGNATTQVQVPPFPCAIASCVRGGAYGFYRLVDLLEHQNMMHLLDFQEYSSVQEFPLAMQLTQQDGNPDFEF